MQGFLMGYVCASSNPHLGAIGKPTITTTMKNITSLFAIGVASLCIQSASANLIVNGNFSAGNTGFQSDYTYVVNNTAAGQYGVVANGQSFYSGFYPVTGYGGSGLFMAVNGATNTTQSPWYQTISNPSVSLTSDLNNPTYYRFEAMIANLVGPSLEPPNLSFEVNIDGAGWNALTGTPNISQFTGQWIPVYVDTYLTSAPSSIGFRLRNQSTNDNGNDFTLDNLYFGLTTEAPTYASSPTIRSAGNIASPTYVAPAGSTVPEPGTWAAAALLAGSAAFARWRKRAKIS
jgi:hypothetical protein